MLSRGLLGVFLFLLGDISFAQSIGLSEGLMGNSGAAARFSTASSFYNPSLLGEKSKDSFAISGTSFSNISSSNENSKTSSLSLAPSFLSSIITGDAVNHELFYVSILSGSFTTFSDMDVLPGGHSAIQSTNNLSNSLAGYSLAFRSFPLGLQMAVGYFESSVVGFSEFHDPNANTHSSTHLTSSFRRLDLLTGVSTHVRFQNGYSFGVNFRTASVLLYRSMKSDFKTFRNVNGAYSEQEDNTPPDDTSNSGNFLVIGHSFAAGKHEFLTDSTFSEENAGHSDYRLTQSFGYRYGSENGTQFYCGGNHLIYEDIHYVGQNFYVSSGLSWKTTTLRSSFGGYFSKNRESDTVTTNYGVVLASQFSY